MGCFNVSVELSDVINNLHNFTRGELTKLNRNINSSLYGNTNSRIDEEEIVEFNNDTIYDYYTNKVLKQLSEKYTLEELESFLK